jgi:hypothetical protein
MAVYAVMHGNRYGGGLTVQREGTGQRIRLARHDEKRQNCLK